MGTTSTQQPELEVTGWSQEHDQPVQVESTTMSDVNPEQHVRSQADLISSQNVAQNILAAPPSSPTTDSTPSNSQLDEVVMEGRDQYDALDSVPCRIQQQSQDNSSPSLAASSEQHVEVIPADQTVEIPKAEANDHSTLSSTQQQAVPAVFQSFATVSDDSTAMDLTPEAASLLPNSGVPRPATPLMEAEPVTAIPDPIATPVDEAMVEFDSTAMELTPDAASLLPNSGIPRSATPMMEAEPVTTTSDVVAVPADETMPDSDAVPSHEDIAAHTAPVPPAAVMAAAAQLNSHNFLPDAGEPALGILPDVLPLDVLPLEAEEGAFSDTDSALGGMSYVSSLTSVTDSIYEAIEEHGRTYHSYKAGKYVLPNDVPEQERLDTQHTMFMMCNDGKLFLSPLEEHRVARVLDIATGTGIWAIDFADDFPLAEVIGSDLSPIQPRWCPPNCHFEVDDAEDDWVWNQPFSFIHGRALVTCFADPKDVIRKAFQALEPGGWFELQDVTFPFDYEDPDLPPVEEGRMDRPYENPLQRWEQLTFEASIRGGRRWDNTRKYKQMYEEVGFVNVTEIRQKMPLGVWGSLSSKEKKIGALHGPSIHAGLEGMSHRNLQRLGLPQEDIVKYLEEARAVMAKNNVGAHNWCYTVYGRRPE